MGKAENNNENCVALFIVGITPDKLYGYDLEDLRYVHLGNIIQKKLIESGCTELCTGLDLGVSTLAALEVIKLKHTGHNIKLKVYVPCKDRDKKWKSYDRELYKLILKDADEVIQVSNEEYDNSLLRKRNHVMIDDSHSGIAIINSDVSLARSEVKNSIDYASYNEKNVHIIDVGTGINKQRSVASKASNKTTTDITLEVLEAWRDLDNFIVMDLETTGFRFAGGNRIIDIGAFEVSGSTIVNKYEQLVNPQQLIPLEITNLTGITNNMVKVKPTIGQVMPVLLEYIGNKYVVFHNSDFDYLKFIKPTYDALNTDVLTLNVLCTLKLDRFIRDNVKKHNLGIVYKDLTGKEPMACAHRASVDALMTAEVAVILRDFIRLNWEYVKGKLK